MYIQNGIVYGSPSSSAAKIISVKAMPDKILILTFANGEDRLFDASILTGPAFDALNDPEVFNHPVIEHGVVVWADGAIDCAPEYMYKNSYEYCRPGRVVA